MISWYGLDLEIPNKSKSKNVLMLENGPPVFSFIEGAGQTNLIVLTKDPGLHISVLINL